MKNVLIGGAGLVGSAAAYLIGGWDMCVLVFGLFMAIDYLTGFTCAYVFHKSPKTESGDAESRAGFKGLIRKGCMILVVIMAHLLDMLSGYHVFRDGVCYAFILNEGLSILENMSLMGVYIPEPISRGLELIASKGDKEHGEI